MGKEGKWVRQERRWGCNRGGKNGCNCEPCKESQRLLPRGLLLHNACAAGFSNVHDYVVHLRTIEFPNQNHKRPACRGWFQTAHMRSMNKKQMEKYRHTEREDYARKVVTQSDAEVKIKLQAQPKIEKEDRPKLELETGHHKQMKNGPQSGHGKRDFAAFNGESLVDSREKEHQSTFPTRNFECMRAARQYSEALNIDVGNILSCDSTISTTARSRQQLLQSSIHISDVYTGDSFSCDRSKHIVLRPLNRFPLSSMMVEKEQSLLESYKVFQNSIGHKGVTCMGPQQKRGPSSYNAFVQAEKKDLVEAIQVSKHGKFGQGSATALRMKKQIVEPALKQLICIADEEEEDKETAWGIQIHQISVSNKFGDVPSREKTKHSRVPTQVWEVEIFQKELDAKVKEPFNAQQLEEMWKVANCRKPINGARETRQGTLEFVTKEQGYSYLDHHPDLAHIIASNNDPKEKLALLRGFFFWLEHASAPGAFKPWIISTSWKRANDEDCAEVDGPDCEVLAMVLPLDVQENVEHSIKRRQDGKETREDA